MRMCSAGGCGLCARGDKPFDGIYESTRRPYARALPSRMRLASSKTARLRPMPKRVRAPPNGHKRGLRLSGKFVVLRYFTHNEPYMKRISGTRLFFLAWFRFEQNSARSVLAQIWPHET